MSLQDYTLLDKLGTGDMGTCYRATHPDSATPVVVKLLDRVDTSNHMKRGSAMEILEFVTGLQHSRLHPLSRAIETDEGEIALVMPFAAQRSLADVLAQQGKLPSKLALQIVAQTASALQFLHEQEVAHGSIKPTNILLNEEGRVSVTDLSMAHLRELGFVPAQMTEQHQYYLSPEREYHSPPIIEGDVFSLSVLAYYLLVGKLPFDDPEPEARSPVPTGGLPPAIAAVLRRAVNPLPRLRYTDLTSFMEALKLATQGKVDEQTEKLFGTKDLPRATDNL